MKEKKSTDVKIHFIGDTSFNDGYIDFYKQKINPFTTIEELLKTSDYRVANLECMAEGQSGENLAKNPRVKTTAETLNFLDTLSINLVSTATNHAYDTLESGYFTTMEILNQKGIAHIGTGATAEEAAKPAIQTINGISFAFLNYLTPDTNPNIPPSAGITLNPYNEIKICQDILSLKDKVDHVILLLHWGGNVEKYPFPHYKQPKSAKRFINAGASAIIGHHSHTLQPWTLVNGHPIFYSIGNFCFADIHQKEVQHKMGDFKAGIVELVFSKKNVKAKLFHIKSRRLVLSLDNSLTTRVIYNLKQTSFSLLQHTPLLWNAVYKGLRFVLPAFILLQDKDRTFAQKCKRISKVFKG